jgi:hypothetical protein
LARIGSSGGNSPYDVNTELVEVDNVFFTNGILVGNPTGILVNDSYDILVEGNVEAQST